MMRQGRGGVMVAFLLMLGVELAPAAPNDIGGLVCWLQGDSITGLNNGDLISSWNDQSGGGHTFFQTDSNHRPTWYAGGTANGINNHATVRFNGVGNYFVAGNFIDFPSLTVFVVARSYQSGRYLFTDYGDPASKKIVLTPGSLDTFVARSADPTVAMTVNLTNAYNNAFEIGEMILDSAATTLKAKIIRGDGSSVTGSDTQGGYTPDTFEGGAPPTLGAYNDGGTVENYFDGCVAEFIIYNRALNATEIAQVEEYLYKRYYEVVVVPPPATYGPNLVNNGDFSAGMTQWNYWATNDSLWNVYGAFGSASQWNVPADAGSCGSVYLDSGSGIPTPGAMIKHTATYGALGFYQAVKVAPGAKYVVNADWKSTTGLSPYCWAEYIVYNATQAEVDDMSLVLPNVNSSWPQRCIVAKKDSWPNLNGGPYPWDWQPITDSLGGGFDHSTGTQVVTATKDYLIVLTKVGGGFAGEGYFLFDNVSLQLGSVPGDANYDGKVDVSDLGILAANYGGTGKSWGTGDFNGDGKVDVSDLGILAANYGRGAAGATQAEDFPRDLKAMGLSIAGDENVPEKEMDVPAAKGLGGCGSAGLPLVAGVFLMGGLLIRAKE